MGDTGWQRPVVAEYESVARVFIFDGRSKSGEVPPGVVDQWCRRVLLRGDPAWTAILRPGRLEVLSFEIHGKEVEKSSETVTPGSGGLTKFIHDVRSGAADLPRRAYLKDLLSASMEQAVAYGLTSIDAVSLVGWGLFWRFLVDRKLLVGKKPYDIAEGAESWQDCLSTKGRALKTLKWLDRTFNGGLLPFEASPQDYPPEVFSQVLGNIAAGATAQGQLRLPTDWDEINFAHMPVGLLSEVYEAFATTLSAPAARAQSIHYTPRHIAEFVVGEALSAIVDIDRPRILDPAVGAGVFLIASFRQLVQREWERTQVRPKRREIRRILSKQLVAFDIDNRALRLTQLGLYLTALELDPNPAPIEDLRFDNLEGVLHLRTERDGSLSGVGSNFAGQFDLVVGNPPWTSGSLAEKKRWVAETGKAVTDRLGHGNGSFDLPDANPDLAFLWRAGEWVKAGGQIALVIHARWMFGLSDRSFKARRQIFSAFRITGILNGAALRQTKVWPNIKGPFCLVFARNEPARSDGAFQFVSPFVEADNTSEQTVLRVEWADAQAISYEEVRSVPSALKSRFRGDFLARRALETVRTNGVPLADYLEKLKPGLQFRNGYQVGGSAGKQQSAKQLHGMRDLKGSAAGTFLIDVSLLPKFRQQTLLFPRNPAIYKPPLLLVRKAIPADHLSPRAMRCNDAVAFHESFHGVSFSGIDLGDSHARLLQLILQSRLGAFVSLLTDPLYGVERETLYMESFESFPVIPLGRLGAGQLARMRRLSEKLEHGLNIELLETLNDFVFGLYHLDAAERAAIQDTLDTRGPTAASVNRAVTPPIEIERAKFYSALKGSLDDVLQASGLSATLNEVRSGCIPWRVLSISTGNISPMKLAVDELLKEADESGASLLILPVNRSQVFVGIPDRYRHWTETQAILLAHELLAGPLGDG